MAGTLHAMPGRSSSLYERLCTLSVWSSLEDRGPYRVARALKAAVLVSDRPSYRRFRQHDLPPGTPIELRLRPLGGKPVTVRSGTPDMWAITDTFLGYFHRPPDELVDIPAVREVWDLGANIGMSMADLAEHFPNASVVGVELDETNFGMCRRNIALFGGRCEVLHAGVWTEDGHVNYDGSGDDPLAFHIDRDAKGGVEVRALSLNSLLAERDGRTVDFVKMDIESAEREVLREHTEWAANVSVLSVEVHEPYTVAECLTDLEALGFEAWVHPSRPTMGKPPVIGVRR